MPIFGAGDALVGTIGIVGSVQFIGATPATAQRAQMRGIAAALSNQLGSSYYERLAPATAR